VAAERPDRVLKAGSSRATAVLVWLCCGIVAGYLLLVQDIGNFLRFGPFVALTAWLAYLAQWLPRLVISRDGVRIVNGLKTHTIPFSQVQDLEVRHSVRITANGRRFTSWGAPVPRNAIAAGLDVSRGRQIQVLTPTNEHLRAAEATDPGRDAIVQAWAEAKRLGFGDGGGTVVSTWNLGTIAVGILAVIWVVVSPTL
jgi:hypothetical protein